MKKKSLKSLSLNKTKVSLLGEINSVVGGSFTCTGPHCTISCGSKCLCEPEPDPNESLDCNLPTSIGLRCDHCCPTDI